MYISSACGQSSTLSALQVTPQRWNVQLVKYVCSPNDLKVKDNLADNISADITVLHGNAGHFKLDRWFSRHVWFLFSHPSVQRHGDALPYFVGADALCLAREHVHLSIGDHLGHCSWQV